jgi:hypothetical protein
MLTSVLTTPSVRGARQQQHYNLIDHLPQRRTFFGLFKSDPVLAAVKDGNVEALRDALAKLQGRDGGEEQRLAVLNKKDLLGYRPIDYAAADGSAEGATAVELLVAAGASPDAAKGKESVLMAACEHAGKDEIGARMATALLSGGVRLMAIAAQHVEPISVAGKR